MDQLAKIKMNTRDLKAGQLYGFIRDLQVYVADPHLKQADPERHARHVAEFEWLTVEIERRTRAEFPEPKSEEKPKPVE